MLHILNASLCIANCMILVG